MMMREYEKDLLISAHASSIRHRAKILESEKCGCFYCLEIFKSNEIKEWVDEENSVGQTALCPHCRIDSVIGSASNFPIDNEFLEQMNRYYF